MFEKKNQVTVLIEDCRHCPNAKLKFVKEEEEDYMYCQTVVSCIQLRKGWGYCPIPSWCPRLARRMNLCGKRAEVCGIVS